MIKVNYRSFFDNFSQLYYMFPVNPLGQMVGQITKAGGSNARTGGTSYTVKICPGYDKLNSINSVVLETGLFDMQFQSAF